MYDWPDATHFGDKAMLSARGVVPTPERLSDSRLPATATGAIAAAHAQARFDCWVEQQGENWQIDDIARCSDDLHAALAELEKAELATGAASVHLAVYEHGVREGPAASEDYALFFAFDRADLAAEELATVQAISALTGRGGSAGIVIAGHADRARPESYNRTLSWHHAESVRDALVALGVIVRRAFFPMPIARPASTSIHPTGWSSLATTASKSSSAQRRPSDFFSLGGRK